MQGVAGNRPGPDVLARGGNNTWAPDVISLWLTYGSYFGYIRLVQLNPKTGQRLYPDRKPVNIAINAHKRPTSKGANGIRGAIVNGGGAASPRGNSVCVPVRIMHTMLRRFDGRLVGRGVAGGRVYAIICPPGGWRCKSCVCS
jgi:hypothetical protein